MAKPLCDDYLLLNTIIRPALMYESIKYGGNEAECMLIAIAIQESNVTDLYQIGSDGKPLYQYARGLWQFELGAVELLMKHDACTWMKESLYSIFGYSPSSEEVHQILPAHFVVATIVARANLWWHSQPLPTVALESEDYAWEYYIDCWNPGKPHRERWHDAWSRAVSTVGGGLVA